MGIAAVQTDVIFDTSSFVITDVRATDRTNMLSIFQYSHFENGIRIAFTGLGLYVTPGSGPVALIIFDVNEGMTGEHPLIIDEPIAADPLGIMMFCLPRHGTVTSFTGTAGDIDNNNTIDILDVVLGVRIMLGLNPNPTPRELAAADCNGNGIIGIYDILGIVNVILNLDTCSP